MSLIKGWERNTIRALLKNPESRPVEIAHIIGAKTESEISQVTVFLGSLARAGLVKRQEAAGKPVYYTWAGIGGLD